MSTAADSATRLDPARPVVEQLRERMAALESGPARERVPTLPGLADVVSLSAGATYGVDSAALAVALAAGASRAGEWVGFVGLPDFGAEAASELGLELTRTVLVPDAGEHWLEVAAALVDVLKVVVLRPPALVADRAASVLEARLRTRSSVLVVWGEWPRCEARVGLTASGWQGPRAGRGWLRERRATVVVRRGSRPSVPRDLWFPGGGALVAPVAPLDVDEPRRAASR